jgi:hypothetical protein
MMSTHTSSNNDDIIFVKVFVTVVLTLNRSISSNGLPYVPKILLDRASLLLLLATARRPADTDDHDGVKGDCEQRGCGANSHAAAKTRVSTGILDDLRGERGHGFGP